MESVRSQLANEYRCWLRIGYIYPRIRFRSSGPVKLPLIAWETALDLRAVKTMFICVMVWVMGCVMDMKVYVDLSKVM